MPDSNHPLLMKVSNAQGKVIFPEEAFVLTNFKATEAISQMFHCQLFFRVPGGTPVPFDKLLGQQVSVTLAREDGKQRFFHGICSALSEGARDHAGLLYRATVVPELWLLTRTVRSRVFTGRSVCQIVAEVLEEHGLKGKFAWQTQGKYPRHDFCTQYRESDFNFISRLLEEEGIYYFFKHSDHGHQLILADASSPKVHPAVDAAVLFGPSRSISFTTEFNRLYEWEKGQQLRANKFTLRDHHFALNQPITAEIAEMRPTVQVGTVPHELKLGADREISDHAGEFAHRFDGIDLSGGDASDRLGMVHDDKGRTAKLRIEQEATAALLIRGSGSCAAFAAGSTFQVTEQSAKGKYLVVSVTHAASQSADIFDHGSGFTYQNGFGCLPFNLEYPFRPPRQAPRPVIPGTQTATVVGLDAKNGPDQEIFTDRFGRVKVQFHWDREHHKEAKCSCWVRVAQVSAGKNWGSFFWPRVGQEVVVAFLEGNPDQPIIVGSVYNANQTPPYLGAPGAKQPQPSPDPKHPNNPRLSGIKTNTTPGGEGFNELRFDDTKGKEQVFIHAERNMDTRVKNDSLERTFGNRHCIIGWDKDGQKGGDRRELIYQDQHLNVKRNLVEHVEGNVELLVGKGDATDGGNVDIVIAKDKKELIEKDNHVHVKGNRNEKVDTDQSLTVGMNRQEKVGQNHALEAGMAIHIKAGQTLVLEAGTQLSLKVGDNFIDINPGGVFIKGTMVMINSGGAAGSGAGAKPTEPADAKEAMPARPALADDAKTGRKSAP